LRVGASAVVALFSDPAFGMRTRKTFVFPAGTILIRAISGT
jgi:hypothetical protein